MHFKWLLKLFCNQLGVNSENYFSVLVQYQVWYFVGFHPFDYF